MTIPTVAFSVQVGSEGFAIARETAHRLGYGHYDWEITAWAHNLVEPGLEPLAEEGLAERIMTEVLAAAVFEQEVPPAMLYAPSQVQEQAIRIHTLEKYRARVEQTVWDLALKGSAVIVGHGAQAILMGQQHVLSVLVVSPFQLRAERLAAAKGSPLAEVTSLLADLDDLKRTYLNRTYGLRWLDPSNYDLVINTAAVPPDMAAAMIVAAAALEKLPALDLDEPAGRSIESVTMNPRGRLRVLPDAA